MRLSHNKGIGGGIHRLHSVWIGVCLFDSVVGRAVGLFVHCLFAVHVYSFFHAHFLAHFGVR